MICGRCAFGGENVEGYGRGRNWKEKTLLLSHLYMGDGRTKERGQSVEVSSVSIEFRKCFRSNQQTRLRFGAIGVAKNTGRADTRTFEPNIVTNFKQISQLIAQIWEYSTGSLPPMTTSAVREETSLRHEGGTIQAGLERKASRGDIRSKIRRQDGLSMRM